MEGPELLSFPSFPVLRGVSAGLPTQRDRAVGHVMEFLPRQGLGRECSVVADILFEPAGNFGRVCAEDRVGPIDRGRTATGDWHDGVKLPLSVWVGAEAVLDHISKADGAHTGAGATDHITGACLFRFHFLPETMSDDPSGIKVNHSPLVVRNDRAGFYDGCSRHQQGKGSQQAKDHGDFPGFNAVPRQGTGTKRHIIHSTCPRQPQESGGLLIKYTKLRLT